MTVAIANVRTIFLKLIFYFCHYSVMIVQGKDEVLFQKGQGKARNAFSKTQKHDCKGNKKISKRLRRKPIL